MLLPAYYLDKKLRKNYLEWSVLDVLDTVECNNLHLDFKVYGRITLVYLVYAVI